jgi:hypothetical protein
MALRLLSLLILSLIAGTLFGQAKPKELVINRPDQGLKLVDEFGKVTAEDRSARFDSFFIELSQIPNSTGYVYLYCGRTCRYDEIAGHIKGIEVKIALRKFDRSRIVILNAGFKQAFDTELWVVSKNGCLPKPRSSIGIRSVDFVPGNRNRIEAYDCCGIDFEKVWESIRP